MPSGLRGCPTLSPSESAIRPGPGWRRRAQLVGAVLSRTGANPATSAPAARPRLPQHASCEKVSEMTRAAGMRGCGVVGAGGTLRGLDSAARQLDARVQRVHAHKRRQQIPAHIKAVHDARQKQVLGQESDVRNACSGREYTQGTPRPQFRLVSLTRKQVLEVLVHCQTSSRSFKTSGLISRGHIPACLAGSGACNRDNIVFGHKVRPALGLYW